MESDMQTLTLPPVKSDQIFFCSRRRPMFWNICKTNSDFFCIHKFQIILRIKENPEKIVYWFFFFVFLEFSETYIKKSFFDSCDFYFLRNSHITINYHDSTKTLVLLRSCSWLHQNAFHKILEMSHMTFHKNCRNVTIRDSLDRQRLSPTVLPRKDFVI